jgi:hypothetical protein
MDTSPGRTCARVAEAEDFLPGGTHYEQHIGGSREGGLPRGPVQQNGIRKVLTCFNCANQGTSHAIVGRKNMAHKDHHTLDKAMKKTKMPSSLAKYLMNKCPNNKQWTGSQG